MSKFDPELPTMPLYVVNKGGVICLEVRHAWAAEELSKIPHGTELDIKYYRKRSQEKLGLYWVILNLCVDNSDNKYGSSRDLHSALKIALGYEHRIKRLGHGPGAIILKSARYCLRKLDILRVPKLNQVSEWLDRLHVLLDQLEDYVGDTIVLPGSISFASMSEAEFSVYFDKAMLELEMAGYPISEYLKNAECESQRNKNYSPSYPRNGAHHGRSQTSRSRDRRVEEDASREEAA